MSERDGVERYEARWVPGGVPTNCCDYGVVSLARGVEVCRVWREDDARLIADLLNARALPPAEPDEPTAEMVEAGWKWSLRRGLDANYQDVQALLQAALCAARPAGGREGGA